MTSKILLCVSKTGGGHHSAAEAVQYAIERTLTREGRRQDYEVVIADVIENTNPVHSMFVGLYNYLLQKHQDWMKYYIAFIEKFKPDNSAIGYWLACGVVKRLLKKVDPVIVVSLHPMTNHYLARAIKALPMNRDPDLLIVVTDPNSNLWSGWACKDAVATVVPNCLAGQKLESLGIDPDKIKTMGMPVHPSFTEPPKQSRAKFLTDLGLAADVMTVCLTAGWAGGGSMEQIYNALADVRKNIQVLVVCGKNDDLLEEMKSLAEKMPFKSAIVPELDSLSDAMHAVDLLVTKAGGLTTYEAVARRLPMALDMLTEPMPQESGTAELLIETNLAKPIRHPYDIVAIVESTDHVDDREKLPLPEAYNLNRTEAAYEIAALILDNCDSREISYSPRQQNLAQAQNLLTESARSHASHT